MATATMTTKGQVTIPKAVREHLGVDTGDRVNFVIHSDGTVVVHAMTRHVRELAGVLYRPGRRALSVKQMNEGIAERMRRKLSRGR